jgi:hypothetical protein
MKHFLLLISLVFVISCSNPAPTETNQNGNKSTENTMTEIPQFDQEKADYLYKFAFECIEKEYPNKLGQVLGDETYLKPPKELHPAFYGCFDWHSSVHGHWTLVNIVEMFPRFEKNKDIIEKLKRNISKENIEQEVRYFDDKYNATFERTYGWAWALKLAESLRDSNNSELNQLGENLKPLTELVVGKYLEFLPKLTYPIRVGEHTNTAFGLSFALDYARKYDKKLEKAITERAKEYYQTDKKCPLTWEPSGFDFLSPCLQEASLMLKVLTREDYEKWLDEFLPGFRNSPDKFIEPAKVSDASDGKLAHLDGLNFSRAWCLYEMGAVLENKNLIAAANKHFNFSYEKIDSGEYAGEHWLASFAAYALIKGRVLVVD